MSHMTTHEQGSWSQVFAAMWGSTVRSLEFIVVCTEVYIHIYIYTPSIYILSSLRITSARIDIPPSHHHHQLPTYEESTGVRSYCALSICLKCRCFCPKSEVHSVWSIPVGSNETGSFGDFRLPSPLDSLMQCPESEIILIVSYYCFIISWQ